MPEGLSRKAFLERSGLAALGAAGIYSILGELGAAPARAAIARASLPPEQHLMQGLRVITDNDVLVNVQPLYHQVVTATLKVDRTKKALQEAKHELEVALQAIERQFAPTPSGPRRDRRLGNALLPQVRPGCRRAQVPGLSAGRSQRGRPGSGRQPALPERSGEPRARAERRRDRLRERLARPRDAAVADALRIARARLRADEHPQGLRRRRLRWQAQHPEGDGDEGCASPAPRRYRRARSCFSASPRRSEARSAPTGSRTSRRCPALPTSGRTATSATGR